MPARVPERNAGPAARLTRLRQRCKLAAAITASSLAFIVANHKPRSQDPITAPPSAEGSTAPDFERSLAELEAIVDKLEAGDLSLDESLKQFERGVQLTRVCQTALKQAEQKVESLMRRSGTNELEAAPFQSADPSAIDQDG